MNTNHVLLFAVDLVLKSSVIFVFAWLVLLIWKRASASQRSYIWCVALALIAVLPLTRLVAPHWALSFSEPSAPVEPIPTMGPSESSVIVPDEIVSTPPVRSWALPDGGTLGMGVWLAGIFVLVAYRLAGAFLLYRYHRSSSPFRVAGKNMATSIGADFGITRGVDIRMSVSCRVPVTWGTWRPVVMLPTEALNWPQKWLESALRHEMGHVKNFDHLKRLVAFLTCAFYWPNPLVWAAARQLKLAQEEASDNLVLRVGVSPQDYAMQLIELIRSSAGRDLLSAPVVAMARPSTLEGRLAAILDDTRNRKNSGPGLVVAAVGFAVIIGLALGAAQLRADDSSFYQDDLARADRENPYFTAAVDALTLPQMEFRQAKPQAVADAIEAASAKANPGGLPLRFFVFGPDSRVDLKLEAGSLRTALASFAKATGLPYKVLPLNQYRIAENRITKDNVLVFRLKAIICQLSSSASSLPLIDVRLSLPDRTVGLLGLTPDASGDVRRNLQAWGILFPPGTMAACRTSASGKQELELKINPVQNRQLHELMQGIVATPDAPTDAVGTISNKLTAKPNTDADQATMMGKLHSIIIEKVSFNKADISDVIQFLQNKSKELDPDHQGINFVLRLTGDPPVTGAPAPILPGNREVTLSEENVSLGKVIAEACRQTDLQYFVEDYAVYIRPAIDESEVLTVRTYLVPAGLLNSITPASGNTVWGSGRVDVKEQLGRLGIRFPAGATAVFLPDSQKMVIRDTPDQLDAVEDLIAKFSTSADSAEAPTASSASPMPFDINRTLKSPQGTLAPIIEPVSSDLDQKLNGILLSLDFKDATIAQATSFLNIESKRLDPERKGVSFSIQPEALKSAKTITLTLNDVTLGEALQYVCRLAGVKFKLEDGDVIAVIASTQDTTDPIAPNTVVQAATGSDQALANKLKSIVIDKINFNKLDIVHVLQFLTFKSKQFDPQGKGINFVLGNITPQDHVHREVTIVLDYVPLNDVLGYITSQTNLKWSIQDNAVYFYAGGSSGL
jgi:beta-lactamase regulating signal transducer with metallopeptidase domain